MSQGYQRKPNPGQRESRVQKRDPKGRDGRLDATALLRAFGMFAGRKGKAA